MRKEKDNKQGDRVPGRVVMSRLLGKQNENPKNILHFPVCLKIGFHFVAHFRLKLTMYPKLTLNSQSSSLSLLNTSITDVPHHT